MKRFTALFLAIIITICCTACGSSNPSWSWTEKRANKDNMPKTVTIVGTEFTTEYKWGPETLIGVDCFVEAENSPEIYADIVAEFDKSYTPQESVFDGHKEYTTGNTDIMVILLDGFVSVQYSYIEK